MKLSLSPSALTEINKYKKKVYLTFVVESNIKSERANDKAEGRLRWTTTLCFAILFISYKHKNFTMIFYCRWKKDRVGIRMGKAFMHSQYNQLNCYWKFSFVSPVSPLIDAHFYLKPGVWWDMLGCKDCVFTLCIHSVIESRIRTSKLCLP